MSTRRNNLKLRCPAGFALALMLLALSPSSSAQQGPAPKSIDTLQDAVVRITVGKGPNRSPNVGTGFVVAVQGRQTVIVTALHLFYPNADKGEAPFEPTTTVEFHADRRHPKPANLLRGDLNHLGIAVLEVRDAGLAPLPHFDLRTTALTYQDHFRVLSSDEDWSLPEMAIAALNYAGRTDRFTYSGNGLTPGYSGSPVVDLDGLLVGIHQGETDGGRKLGWAQRIQVVDETLNKVLGIRTNFGPTVSERKVDPPPPTTGLLRDGRDGLKYVWIGPGTFTMGCSPNDSECEPDEKPAHQVTLSKGFWMGQTPVTVAAWKRYAAAIKRNTVPIPTKNDSVTTVNSDDQAPVVAVTWEEAQAYCWWAGGLRLPTEAQWEYAARAGSTGARYGDLEKIAMKDSLQRVPSLALNAWNLYNMLGSVWQWTADWYSDKYYTPAAATDPRNAARGDFPALRGGSWNSDPQVVRASGRSGDRPASRNFSVGFRCNGE